MPAKLCCKALLAQPPPRTPGLTRRMVREHAARLFRDVYPKQSLTPRQWRLVEHDLACKIEREGF